MRTIIIPGKPMGKQRPRITKFGTHTPQKTINYETLVQQLYIQNYSNQKLLEGELSIEIVAYYEVPKSKPKKLRIEMLENKIRPTVKPDVDNIAKIICDALNGFAYSDDKQIVECNIKKYYAAEPKVEVRVKEV